MASGFLIRERLNLNARSRTLADEAAEGGGGMRAMLATVAQGRHEVSTTFVVASCAFGLSGFSALACQTAWQRMLGLFAGSDAVATTLIVGSFLFGLGLGSLAGGWLADRLSPRAALRAFAMAELGVGDLRRTQPLDPLWRRLPAPRALCREPSRHDARDLRGARPADGPDGHVAALHRPSARRADRSLAHADRHALRRQHGGCRHRLPA